MDKSGQAGKPGSENFDWKCINKKMGKTETPYQTFR